jgi:hypothetical protein
VRLCLDKQHMRWHFVAYGGLVGAKRLLTVQLMLRD